MVAAGERYKLPIGERGRAGSVYDWSKIQEAFIGGYPKRWGSVRGFARKENLPVGLVANRADREKWVDGLESAGVAKPRKGGLERVARNLDVAERAFGLAVRKAMQMLRGELAPNELDKVVRSLKESYISLRLSAEKPTSISVNKEFAFLWYVEPAPYGNAPGRADGEDVPVAVDGFGSPTAAQICGGERGAQDTKDGLMLEVASGKTDEIEGGVEGVVSGPDISAGEDGSVVAPVADDSRTPDSQQERAGVADRVTGAAIL